MLPVKRHLVSKLRISIVLALAAAFSAASVSAARDVTPEEALVELARSRVAAIESVRLYHAGQPEEAHQVALEGYLNHFETVEFAVRGIDLGLMVTTELMFIRLRASIGNAGAAGDVDQLAVRVLDGFDRVERALSAPGPETFVVGAVLAAAAGLILVFVVTRGRRWRMGAVAGLAILTLPVAGHAIRTLQTMDLLPTHFMATPDLSAHMTPLLGLHPTLETLLGQALLVSAWVSLAVVLVLRRLSART
jgi:hypothetical protein